MVVDIKMSQTWLSGLAGQLGSEKEIITDKVNQDEVVAKVDVTNQKFETII